MGSKIKNLKHFATRQSSNVKPLSTTIMTPQSTISNGQSERINQRAIARESTNERSERINQRAKRENQLTSDSERIN